MNPRNPQEWAAQLIEQQGLDNAYAIVNVNKRERLGKDQDVRNTQATFYRNAYSWMKKRFKEPEQQVQKSA